MANKFIPVQGTEAEINTAETVNGYVYFATDTGKIFLGTNDQKVLMGRSSGVFYGKLNISKFSTETTFDFKFSDLEGINKPNINDLVLDIDTGIFYRVMSLTETGGTVNKVTSSGDTNSSKTYWVDTTAVLQLDGTYKIDLSTLTDVNPQAHDLVLTKDNKVFMINSLEDNTATCTFVKANAVGSNAYWINTTAVQGVDQYYTIDLSSLEDGNPKENDLLITNDSKLFLIKEIDSGIASCAQISGSGGGGGGTTYMTIKTTGFTSYDVTILGLEKNLTITVATEEAEITKVPITVTIRNSYGGVITDIVKQIPAIPVNEPYEYELGSLLPIGTNKVTLNAVAEVQGVETTATKSIMSLSTVVMALNASDNFNALKVWENGTVDFRCIPIGENLTKTLYIDVDGVRQPDLTKTNIVSSGAEVQVTITGLSHGRHNITATLTANSDLVQTSLSYQVACIEEDNNTPIVWAKEDSISIVEHDKMLVHYMVYNPEASSRGSVTQYLNGSLLATGTIDVAYSSSEWKLWSIPTNKYIIGDNELSLVSGKDTLTIIATVAQDTERTDFNVITSGLLLNLDASGRSNNENITSRNVWNTEGKTDYVTFNNFNWYNNGWITDDNDDTCLRVSNGASISIPLSIFKEKTLTVGKTVEMIFKVRNVQKYSTLIENVEDETTHEIKQTVSSTEGVSIKYYHDHVGFCVGTQESFFTSRNNTVSCRYMDDEIVHLTYVIEPMTSTSPINNVPLIYVYLNGLLCGIQTYSSTDSFDSGSELTSIDVNSDYCDTDIYKIRVYDSALAQKDVVRNYIADIGDVDVYDANQIVNYTNNIPNIDYNKMIAYNEKHPDAPMMPYAVITTDDISGNPDNLLPYYKKEDKELEYYDTTSGEWKTKKAWTVNIDFVNPMLDYLYDNGKISNAKYLTSCPSYSATDADLNVQGTSSQSYPRRNYKAKFKNATTWVYTDGPLKGKSLNSKNTLDGIKYSKWYMDSSIATNKFTWKVDYMESSGSHNGGLASFLQLMYDKHPVEDYGVSSEDAKDLRTTMYGFPMMVFHKKAAGVGTGETPEIQFIGKYCYLLDKGCDDNFGFCDFDGVTSGVSDGEGGYLSLGDAAECWQVDDNQGGRCSMRCNFKNEDGSYDFEKLLTETYVTSDNRTTLSIGRDFEVRYHKDKDEIEQAIDQRRDYSGKADEANAFLRDKFKNLYDLLVWISSTDVNAGEYSDTRKLPNPVTYGTTTYEYDSKEYRLAKFTNEFEEHFDKEYCLVYFIITELLMCFDSRGKNMMLATWGPHVTRDSSGAITKVGDNYIWYPIFYDMDTQLGINNSGVPYWDYYEEVTKNNTFSTPDSVLWNNLWNCFNVEIKNKYNALRDSLSSTKLNGYYDFDPTITESYAMQGIRPLIMKNIDEYYKYIDCARGSGYVDTTGKQGVTTTGYFYCLQGDRALRREMLLRNRFNYYDSMWVGGTYALTQVKSNLGRVGANNYPSTSDKYLFVDELTEEQKEAGFEKVNSVKANSVDGEWDFSITPYLKQYVTLYFDDNARPTQYCDDGDTKTVTPSESLQETLNKTANKQDQIFYLCGEEFISSLGDLSLKYIDKLNLSTARRLKDLILGNEDPNYYSNRFTVANFTLDDLPKKDGKVNENAKTLLEKVVLTHLGGLTDELNFSGSEKIKEMRALGTNLKSIVLADGVQVEKLYLPETTTGFALTEPVALTDYLTATPTKDETTGEYQNGLYIEGVTDLTNIKSTTAIALDTINVIGGEMGYNSYKLLDIALKAKESMIENWDGALVDPGPDSGESRDQYTRNLIINLTKVNWSPYRLVEYGEKIQLGATYVKKNLHFSFDSYTPDTSTWDADTLNGKVYQYDTTAPANTITDLSVFDKLIASYESTEHYFRGIDGNTSMPYISGEVFINNDSSNPIHESDIRDKYMGKYYPGLSIYVANPAGDYISNFVEVSDNNVETTVDTLAYVNDGSSKPVVETEKKPSTRPHYDWLGWSATKNGEIITDWSAYEFDSTHKEYTFYAVYTIHKYDIKFMNGDNVTSISESQIAYGQKVQAISIMPSKDDSALGDYEGYIFLGWGTKPFPDGGTKEDVVDVTKITVTEDLIFYPVFKKILATETEDLRDYPTDDSYFTVNSSGVITPKSGTILNGKIIIPVSWTDSETGNSIIVRTLGNFQTSQATHILFAKGSQVEIFAGNAFMNNQYLKFIEPISTLTTINPHCFQNTYRLQSMDWSNCTKLTTIGDYAFNAARFGRVNGSESGTITDIYLPGSVTTIGEDAFYYLYYLTTVTTIHFGNKDTSDISYLSNLGVTPFDQQDWYRERHSDLGLTIDVYCQSSEITRITNLIDAVADDHTQIQVHD